MEEITFTNDFFRNLFGTIAQSTGIGRQSAHIDFVPGGEGGQIINISGRGKAEAIWLGLKNPLQQKYAYEYCYPFASIVDRLAEADTTGDLEIIKCRGKGKDDFAKNAWSQNMRKLLAQPNIMQSWEQFRGQQMMYKKVFGFCPVLPIVPNSMSPEYATAMINIPPWLFDPVGTGRMLYESKMEDIIQHYNVTILGQSFQLRPDQIFILEDSFLQDERRGFLLPMSRVCGLDFAISNLCAAMEADNILLRRSGPAGILTSGAKDGVGSSVPLTTEERKEVQDDLAQYGMSWSQFQFMISRNPMQLQTIGFNAKQMGTKETIEGAEKAICHRYNYDYVLYEASSSTYANQGGAHKSLYQNNVIPGNKKDMNKYNKFFKAEENDCKIVTDYSELPIMQENELEKANAAKAWDDALLLRYKNGIITKNMWLTQIGLETVPDGDTYYTESAPEPTTPIETPAE